MATTDAPERPLLTRPELADLLGISLSPDSEIADAIRPTLLAYEPADEPTLLLLATALARSERANAAIERGIPPI